MILDNINTILNSENDLGFCHVPTKDSDSH